MISRSDRLNFKPGFLSKGALIMQIIDHCPSCNTSKMEIFHQLPSVPSNSCILLDSPEEALSYPRGEIHLGFCPECGFISNLAFDQKLTEYSGRYEETQGFSGTFQKFHKELAQRLVDRYGLHHKKVIEIGCGKGEFLVLLCELGENTGIGFDPGFVEDRIESSAFDRITFIKDFYSEKYAQYCGDFICCKMTLEHIHPTLEFMSTVRRAIGNNLETSVFFQIPDATRIFSECAFEDIYYEHCSYFTPGSLSRLFRRCGFEVLDLATEYEGQYLTIEARPTTKPPAEQLSFPAEHDMDALKQSVADFPKKFQQQKERWAHLLKKLKSQGKKTVLWGSGSKGVSFLTTLETDNTIEFVVDINPFRHDFYMSGTGQKIVSPEFLADYKPDAVIVMNAIYRKEIENALQQLRISPEIFVL
jgi:SAM-dependent methyltransferase